MVCRELASNWKAFSKPKGCMFARQISMDMEVSDFQWVGNLFMDNLGSCLIDEIFTNKLEELAMCLGLEVDIMAEKAGLITPPTNP